MTERKYSRKCGRCQQKAMVLRSIPYEVQTEHDGRKYHFQIPSLSVPVCEVCHAVSIDDDADSQIDEAFRREANLLTPKQIREIRLSLQMKQEELAELIGISPSTLSRWETGAQIQQRSFDKFLRAVFRLPALREELSGARDTVDTQVEVTSSVETTPFSWDEGLSEYAVANSDCHTVEMGA